MWKLLWMSLLSLTERGVKKKKKKDFWFRLLAWMCSFQAPPWNETIWNGSLCCCDFNATIINPDILLRIMSGRYDNKAYLSSAIKDGPGRAQLHQNSPPSGTFNSYRHARYVKAVLQFVVRLLTNTALAGFYIEKRLLPPMLVGRLACWLFWKKPNTK